jgi:vacuolar-type H+-ATPase subunit H
LSLEINKLLEIEREAEERIRSARAEADKIINDARRRASEIIKEAETVEFRDLEEEFMKKIGVKREEVLASYREEADKLYEQGMANIDKAVEFVFKWILGVD